MIYVDGVQVSSSSSIQGNDVLVSLMNHPVLVSASCSFAALKEKNVSLSEESSLEMSQFKYVYVFQSEYATVNPLLVDFVGTDEATTCVGVVIRNRESGMVSVAHMDSLNIIEIGLTQMLSLVANANSDAILDVHLIGSYDDSSPQLGVESKVNKNKGGYSFPLCRKIIEVLGNSEEKFQIKTLHILKHNTRWDSEGNASPIFHGFLLAITMRVIENLESASQRAHKLLDDVGADVESLRVNPLTIMVETSTGSVIPASFCRSSRCPDEIVRRIRVSASFGDPTWTGRLLDTYDTINDQFVIAPCIWTRQKLRIALKIQQFSDTEILLRCSTSPSAEGPDFVDNQRRGYEYIIQHPDWIETFPLKLPRVFKRIADGSWTRC